MAASARSPVCFGVVLLSIFACAAMAQTPTPKPACYSSSSSSQYVNTDMTVAVQPSSPVLVQRYQAPFIRVFCVLFTETGPTCTAATAPILCSRPANDPTQPFACELLTDYTSDANSYIERGNINGPELIWDLMWDGTAEGPQCFPRSVNFRALVLVSSSTVSSPAVFAFMLIIALLGFLFAVFVLVWWVKERLTRIDEAGAVTIGGPKMGFQGPQLAVGPNTAPLGDGIDRVYLPVNENGALVNDQSAAGEFGSLQAASRALGTPALAGRRGPRRASPPAPGDGLPGGASQFRGAQRTVFGLNSSDDEIDSDGNRYYVDANGARRYYRDGEDGPVPGSGMRRRRGGKKGKGKGKGGQDDDTEMTFATLFPTEDAWNTNGNGEMEEYLDEDGNPISVAEARRRGMKAPKRFGGPENRVKYIPQWHMGSFGKGGLIPEIGDGDADADYRHADAANREFGKTNTAKSFGRYTSPPRSGMTRRRRPDGTFEDLDEDAEYGSDGQRRPGGRGSLRSPFGRRGVGDESGAEDDYGSGRGTPSRRGVRFAGGGGGVEGDDDAYGLGGPAGGPLRRRRTGGKDDGRDFNADGGLAHGASDAFNRGSATVFSPKVDLGGRGGAGRQTPSRGAATTDDSAKENTFNFKRDGPPPVLQCAKCKLLLGTGNDPIFCAVDGHRHF